MKKKILFRSLVGAPVGATISLLITIIISLCSEGGEYFPAAQGLIDLCGSEITAVIVQFLCSMLIGAVYSGASVIWEIEKWSLTKQTLLHFAVFVMTFAPVSYLLFWMPHNLYGALGYAAVFLFMYLLIWVSIYFPIKAKIKKMNKHLQELRREEKK